MISSTSLFDCSHKIYTITVWKAPSDHISTEFRNRIFHCRADNVLNADLLIHNIYNDMGKLMIGGYDNIVSFINNTFERKELISVASREMAVGIMRILTFMTYDSFAYVFECTVKGAYGIHEGIGYSKERYSLNNFPLYRVAAYYEVNIDNYIKGNSDKFVNHCGIADLLRFINYFRMRPVYSLTRDGEWSMQYNINSFASDTVIDKDTLKRFSNLSISRGGKSINKIKELISKVQLIEDMFNCIDNFSMFKDFLAYYRDDFKYMPTDYIINDGYKDFPNFIETYNYKRKTIIDKTYLEYYVRINDKETARLFIKADGIYSCFDKIPNDFLCNTIEKQTMYIRNHLNDRIVQAIANFNEINSHTNRNFGFTCSDINFWSSMIEYLDIDKNVDINVLVSLRDKEQTIMKEHCRLVKYNNNDSYLIMADLIQRSRNFNVKITQGRFDSMGRFQ